MNRAYRLNLAKIRRRAQAFLTETCQIERKQSGVNAAGQPIGGWQIVDSVPCRAHPVQQRGGLEEIAEQEANVSRYTLELLPDADLKNGDRIRYQQVVYEVNEIAFPITDAIFKSVQITRVNP